MQTINTSNYPRFDDLLKKREFIKSAPKIAKKKKSK